jgi:hypothetical protein
MSVVGVSPGSPEAAAPRSLQPVAVYNSATGVPAVPPSAAADGSQPVSGVNGTSRATAANPLPVNAPGSGGASAIYSDQQVVTASAVALTTQALSNGITIRAKETNTGPVFIGGASVTATNDGTGNGFALLPGASQSYPISTTAGIYVIGTANDIVYVTGS